MAEWLRGIVERLIGPSPYKAQYETLRELYRSQHPRITLESIDAYIDGRIAGHGVAAGPEQDGVQGQKPD